MRNVILVLGMHRSGTSAAAGSLVKLGGAQPKTLMPAEGGNERGYFESQALMIFHEELLASAGSSWTDWRQFNPAWYQSPAFPAFQKRAKQLFKEEFAGEPLAVLKDPRICRFAPFWLEVLAGMKARARVVIPVRSPLEVAFSMRKRNGFSLATGALLWLRHIIDAEIATRALPRSIFTWDQLLRDWRSVAEKASTELGLSWPRLSDATAHEIENFVGYDLVHHRVSARELAAHPDIHEWTMSAYRAMLKLAHAPQSRSALKTLDKTRDAFNRASRMFGRTLLEEEIRSQDLWRETAKLAEERDHWLRQHDAARAELAGALQAKEQISLELNARAREASEFAEQGCQREQAELALAAEKSLNLQLANDLEARTAELADAVAAAEKVLTAERERRDGLTARIADTDAELARERSRSESVKATLAAAESKLAEELTRAKRAESEQAGIAGKLRRKATEADARAEDAGLKVSALERDIERHEQEAAALLRSTSWRLSAPWRAYRRTVSRLRRLLRGKKMNPLFDREWYLQQYPDVRAGELDPYDHYLRHGAAEGRDPSPLFDTDWYLQQNPDVRESGENPLVHFYSVGAKEGRDPSPFFDVRWYLEKNPDVREKGVNPLKHFIEHGSDEGRSPHPLFGTNFYLKNNPDAAASGANPLQQYLKHDANENARSAGGAISSHCRQHHGIP
ncbi:MAG: hypothetical protein WBF43_01055 [Methylocella sp.]